MSLAMRSFILPQSRSAVESDAHVVRRVLWEKYKIQVRIFVWESRLVLRLSGQVYVDYDEIEHFVHCLNREGWPDRI